MKRLSAVTVNGGRTAVKRFALTACAFAFAVAAARVSAAAANSFGGSWLGLATVNGMRCQFQLAMTTTGTYAETERCGPYATSQTGTYRVFPNGTVTFVVTNWTPKQQYIVGAAPGTGRYEATAKPPGGTYRYTFTAPDTMVWRDVTYGGTIAFKRRAG